jgi:hypothetical protein
MLTNEIHKKLLDAGLRDLLIEWGTDPFCVDKEVISDSDLDEFIIRKAREKWGDKFKYEITWRESCAKWIATIFLEHECFARGHSDSTDPLIARALLAIQIVEVE